MTPIEENLFSSAGGSFVLVLMASIFIVIVALLGYLVRWITSNIPAEMEKDRKAFVEDRKATIEQMKEDRAATCERMTAIVEMFKECFVPHNEQARNILDAVNATKVALDERPCALKNLPRET